DRRLGSTDRRFVAIAKDDVSSELGEERRGRLPDARGRPRHERDPTRERKLGLFLEFGLLEAPVLDVEQVLEADRRVRTHPFGLLDDVDRVLVNVSRDLGLFLGFADGTNTEPREEENPRPRVELLPLAFLRDHLVEVVVVPTRVAFELAVDVGSERARVV